MGRRKNKVNKTGRNETEQYVKISYAMVQSDAWRSLSHGALKVWFELRIRYNGRNNGKLSLSLDEGARLLGMSKSTIGRGLKELEVKGFIVKTKQGQWYGRLATEYRVTDKSCDGVPPTHDWRRWRSSVPVSPAKPRVLTNVDPEKTDLRY